MRAEEKLRRDKQLLAKEKAKDREKKRKEENHHKYMMGGIIVKYFPECYHFEEYELNEILSAALATTECQQIIARIKEENAGNINREIRKYNRSILDLARAFITNTGEALIENVKDVTSGFVNEVIDMINRVMERKGRLELPVISGKFLAKVSDRSSLQNGDNAKHFVADNKIESFEGLDKFRADKESEYAGMEKAALSRNQQIKQIKQKASLYYQFSGCREVYEKSRSLKGRAKVKYDREHRELLEVYPRIKDQLMKLLDEGEKLVPKQWDRENTTADQISIAAINE